MKNLAVIGLALATFVPVVGIAATPSPTPAEIAAVKAMHAYEMKPGQNGAASGMKDERCRVVQTWAKCNFSDSGENSNTIVIMGQKSGAWTYIFEYGGVAQPSDFEQHGVPAAIAKQFANPDFE